MSLFNIFGKNKKNSHPYPSCNTLNPTPEYQPAYLSLPKMKSSRILDPNCKEDYEIYRQFKYAFLCMAKHAGEHWDDPNTKEDDKIWVAIWDKMMGQIFPYFYDCNLVEESDFNKYPKDKDGMIYNRPDMFGAAFDDNCPSQLDIVNLDTPEELEYMRVQPEHGRYYIAGIYLPPKKALKYIDMFIDNPTKGFYPVLYRKYENYDEAGIKIAVNLKDLANNIRSHVRGAELGFFDERFGVESDATAPYEIQVVKVPDKESKGYPVAPVDKYHVYVTSHFDYLDIDDNFIVSKEDSDEKFMYMAAYFVAHMDQSIKEVGEGYLTTHSNPFLDQDYQEEEEHER